MKIAAMIAAAAVLVPLTTGFALAETMTKVECPGVNVTLDEKQTAAIKSKTGEENFGRDVCAVATKVDVSTFTEPTPVDVVMPTGETYKVKLQNAM
ncbi:MAG: hypothetical protein DI533_03395 [Cereibacter sphaeroides]|uniref:Uncharacterized protein n=1 Tax=Cereibacter sphaeroides TaxID=1063 RepID=A0A2W5S9L9_CERSP|nr:MAG: hypothetical protein DI533_03395 [Cereibacter sphaeroides]